MSLEAAAKELEILEMRMKYRSSEVSSCPASALQYVSIKTKGENNVCRLTFISLDDLLIANYS